MVTNAEYLREKNRADTAEARVKELEALLNPEVEEETEEELGDDWEADELYKS